MRGESLEIYKGSIPHSLQVPNKHCRPCHIQAPDNCHTRIKISMAGFSVRDLAPSQRITMVPD